MCLLIYKKPGATIPVAHIENGMESNSDGAGFAIQIPESGHIYIDKGLWKAEEFCERLQTAMDYYGGSPGVMIHFRWSTGGKVSPTNCHPFTLDRLPVLRGLTTRAMAHNGVLASIPACDRYSDTYHLARQLSRLWSERKIRKSLQEHSGPGNKFVLLNPYKAHIIGEQHGKWIDGVWYSNDSYKAFYQRYTINWQYDCNDDDLWMEYDPKNDPAGKCLYCDVETARYRIGSSDYMLCYKCRSLYEKDVLGDLTCKSATLERCTTCLDLVHPIRPHYCQAWHSTTRVLSTPKQETKPANAS